MGICSSCEATAVMPLATAKLVLEDGTLQEFSWPVKARHALGKDHRTCFVCSADDMEFDGFVSALGPDSELQLGQLYFVLPRSMLKHPLQPEDMAALAVKASAALMGSSARALDGQKCRLVFAAGTRGDAVEGHERALAEKMRRPRRPGSSGRYFRPALGAIDE